ncbi:MAG: hypothetical protein IJA44_07075 [Clostridia bacterium]|nr:hypothetical protein [Clostridia bacterium]
MGFKTTSTTTTNIPIYAAWECSKCGEKNFSNGALQFQASSSTRSIPTKKEIERIEKQSEKYVDELFQKKAIDIIRDPIKNHSRFRESFYLYNCRCKKCNHKEKWYTKLYWQIPVLALDFLPALLSLTNLLANPANFKSWLFFVFFGGILALCIYSEFYFKKILKKTPQKYMPIIGSLNPILNDLAEKSNYKLLTPDEVQDAIGYKETPIVLPQEKMNKTEKSENDKISIQEQSNVVDASEFCRKCGTKLFGDSEFCHKCGCKIIR